MVCRYSTLVLVVILVTMMCTAAWASNPADPTADFRHYDDFIKLAWDGVASDADSVWFFASKEVVEHANILLFTSYDVECGDKLLELGFTTQVDAGSGTLELGAFKDITSGENDLGAMLDWSNAKFGLGTVLRSNGCSVVAARAQINSRITLNLAVFEGGDAPVRWGLGYLADKIRFEVADDGDTTWFRVCKPAGKYYPELRTKFTETDSLIGFGLGLAL